MRAPLRSSPLLLALVASLGCEKSAERPTAGPETSATPASSQEAAPGMTGTPKGEPPAVPSPSAEPTSARSATSAPAPPGAEAAPGAPPRDGQDPRPAPGATATASSMTTPGAGREGEACIGAGAQSNCGAGLSCCERPRANCPRPRPEEKRPPVSGCGNESVCLRVPKCPARAPVRP